MNEVMQMYQELIIDHAKAPKNFGPLDHHTHHALGNNPLCGDVLTLKLVIQNDVITDVKFVGDGCAIFKASASLMTQNIKGKDVKSALYTFNKFHHMLTKEECDGEGLGKLAVLEGVKKFPMRVKCATLCWHTLNAALNNEAINVTTE